jgi:YD repeat-containing protein
MAKIQANQVELVSGGNVFKQGDETTLVFQFRGEAGEIIDLDGATVKVIIANSTKRVLEKTGNVADDKVSLSFTKDDIITGYGVMRMEFHVTQGGTLRKYPAEGWEQITITPTLDNIEIGGVPFVTAEEIKEVATLAQTTAEQAKTNSDAALRVVQSVDERVDPISRIGDFQFPFDSSNELQQVDAPNGTINVMRQNGVISSVTQTTTDGKKITTTLHYDESGRVSGITNTQS